MALTGQELILKTTKIVLICLRRSDTTFSSFYATSGRIMLLIEYGFKSLLSPLVVYSVVCVCVSLLDC